MSESPRLEIKPKRYFPRPDSRGVRGSPREFALSASRKHIARSLQPVRPSVSARAAHPARLGSGRSQDRSMPRMSASWTPTS